MGGTAEDVLTALRLCETDEGSYKRVREEFDKYYTGDRNTAVERANFIRRQNARESVDDFMTDL